MKMNLSDYIKVYDNALAADRCQELIERFERESAQQQCRDNEIMSFTEINVMQYAWPAQDLMQLAVQYRNRYWADCGITARHINPAHDWEELRMKRYRPYNNEEFRPHTDAWNAATAQRFMVYFWYLNTVEAGGETEFYGLDREVQVQPVQGRLVMFPATWQFLHAGLAPRSGPKYIIGGYHHHG